MTTRELLSALRQGERPAPEAILDFARGLADGGVGDAEAGAFAMAVCHRGLGDEGRAALTRGMTQGGSRLDWALDGPVLDKHSTGGIGDPVSLALAPTLAAVGCYAPMISGRALGHTGGTLDKLEAIPGVGVELDTDEFRRIVADVGCAIVAATADIAPADRRLYAIRDRTGTVDHIDLIVPSILSKKLAAGGEALVFDVKAGAGAFLPHRPAARRLARALVDTAREAGRPAVARLTDMDQPLASAIGTGIEVAQVMDLLTAGAASRLRDVTLELGGALMALAGRPEGREELSRAISDGSAAERFARMVAAMGGPRDFAHTWRRDLEPAPVVRELCSPCSGYIAGIDVRSLGDAAATVSRHDPHPGAGLDAIRPIGSHVAAGEPLLRIHATDAGVAERVWQDVSMAFTLDDVRLEPRSPILEAVE